MFNPKSLKNLKPFKPGENGTSPGKGYSLTSALKFALEHPLEEPKPDAPVRDHIVYRTLKGAMDGDATQFRELWDRAEGKVPLEGKLLGEVTIKVVEE